MVGLDQVFGAELVNKRLEIASELLRLDTVFRQQRVVRGLDRGR
jgi:hypothetical protein